MCGLYKESGKSQFFCVGTKVGGFSFYLRKLTIYLLTYQKIFNMFANISGDVCLCPEYFFTVFVKAFVIFL